MRRTLQQVILFVLGAVFVSAGAACADTHWVNLAGSNQPPFTSYAEGAHSIQDAIDQSIAGDTVRIAAGVHRPDTTVFLKDSVAVIGAGRDSTVIMPWKENLLMFRQVLRLNAGDIDLTAFSTMNGGPPVVGVADGLSSNLLQEE